MHLDVRFVVGVVQLGHREENSDERGGCGMVTSLHPPRPFLRFDCLDLDEEERAKVK